MSTNEAVEAACEAFYNDPSGLTSWERATKVSPAMADRYRKAMARALDAATPHMVDAGGDSAEHPRPHGYKLPSPVVLPDLSDDNVWAECVKRAEDIERESRRTRRRYWLHKLFGPDA